MFDVGASEMLMIVIVAVVVIGPKDMPMAMRTAGRWIGKMRRISGHFRAGVDAMVREAELEEMERKWREQNEAIMNAHPQLGAYDALSHDPAPHDPVAYDHSGAHGVANPHPTSAEAALASLEAASPQASMAAQQADHEAEPQLPLPSPRSPLP